MVSRNTNALVFLETNRDTILTWAKRRKMTVLLLEDGVVVRLNIVVGWVGDGASVLPTLFRHRVKTVQQRINTLLY